MSFLARKFFIILMCAVVAGSVYVLGGLGYKNCYFPFCGTFAQIKHTFINLDKDNDPLVQDRLRLSTNDTDFVLTWHSAIELQNSRYGGLQYDATHNAMLIVSQSGSFFEFRDGILHSTTSLGLPDLPQKVPNFIPDFVEEDRLGVRDFYLSIKDNLAALVVSRVAENSGCHELAVFVLIINSDDRNWSEIFKTNCWNFGTSGGTGGAISGIGDKLFLTIGSNDLLLDPDEVPSNYMEVMAGEQLSRIVEISIQDGAEKTIATGFRNPQGLSVNSIGEMFSIEHGPQGGDELNKILAGHDYGYPRLILGVDYGTSSWPYLDQTEAYAESATPPIYSWVPSIAPSDIEYNAFFTPIRGMTDCELVATSLRQQSLHFIRLNDGCSRAVNIESLHIGERIRKLAINGKNDEFVFITDGTGMIGALKRQ